jgi:hypothetical protein
MFMEIVTGNSATAKRTRHLGERHAEADHESDPRPLKVHHQQLFEQPA